MQHDGFAQRIHLKKTTWDHFPAKIDEDLSAIQIGDFLRIGGRF